jgi:hypothetical protein
MRTTPHHHTDGLIKHEQGPHHHLLGLLAAAALLMALDLLGRSLLFLSSTATPPLPRPAFSRRRCSPERRRPPAATHRLWPLPRRPLQSGSLPQCHATVLFTTRLITCFPRPSHARVLLDWLSACRRRRGRRVSRARRRIPFPGLTAQSTKWSPTQPISLGLAKTSFFNNTFKT